MVDENPYVELQVSDSAFGRRIREFELINFGYKDIERFLLNAFEFYRSKIIEAVTQFHTIKTLSYINAEFERAFRIASSFFLFAGLSVAYLPDLIHLSAYFATVK